MLVSFSLRNFRSFGDGCTLEMMPGKSRSKPEHIVDDCLKIAAVYGANASGKSNLVRGLRTMKAIVTDPYFCGREPLHHWDAGDTVTGFEVEFTVGGLLYRYTIEADSVSNGANSPSKRLYAYPLTYERLTVTDLRYEADRRGNVTETLVFERPSKRRGWPSLGCDGDRMSEMFDRLLRNERLCSELECYAPSNAESRLKSEMGEILGSDGFGEEDIGRLFEVRRRIGNRYEDRRAALRKDIDANKEGLETGARATIDRYPMTVRYLMEAGGIPEEAMHHLRNVSDWFSSALCILDTGDIYLPGSDDVAASLGPLLDSADLGIEGLGWRGLGSRRKQALYSLSVRDQMRVEDARDLSERSPGSTVIVAKSKEGIFRFVCERGEVSAEELAPSRRDGFDTNLFSESDGTVRLIELLSILLPSDRDVTFVVDELDRRLHPMLTRWFVESYLDDPSSRKQLILTTHETGILTPELFRKDEIWFVDRVDGRSEICSLDGLRGVNYNKRLEKVYLDDRALPGIPRMRGEARGERWGGSRTSRRGRTGPGASSTSSARASPNPGTSGTSGGTTAGRGSSSSRSSTRSASTGTCRRGNSSSA